MNKIFTLPSALLLILTLLCQNVKASAVLVTVTSSTNVSCNGTCNGSATTSVTGNVGTVTYLWSPGSQTGANLINACPGTYTVTATDQYDQTQSQATVTITEPALLTLGMTHTDVQCNGGTDGTATATGTGGTGPYTYNWSPISATTSTVSGLAAGNYSAYVTDANGCNANTSVIINQPGSLYISAGADQTICSGSSAFLNTTFGGGTGSWTFSWTPSASLSSATLSNPSAMPAVTTTYTVTITDANACTASDQITVSVMPNPTVTASTNSNVCQGNATLLTASGATSYVWSPTTGLYSPNSDTTGAAPTFTTTYTVTGTTGACSSTGSITVIVYPAANANAGPDASICFGTSTTLNGSGGLSYYWSPGASLSSVSTPNPTTSPSTNTSYVLSVTDANGCTGTDTVVVNVLANPVISGAVNFSGSAVNIGNVIAYRIDSVSTFSFAGNASIDGSGNYYFTGLSEGSYYFKAILDTTAYPGAIPTYSPAAYAWADADIINTTCGGNYAANIDVIQAPQLSGTGIISGQIFGGNGPFKTWQQGDPVPGVDVTLEQNPGSVMLAQTTTDNAGAYTFNNVPNGNFTIYVDVPGLDMSATYDVTLSSSSNAFNDAVFYVDSTGTIDTVRNIVLGIKQSVNAADNITAYPNPYNSFTNIEYTLSQKSLVNIEVYNLMGEKITVLQNTGKEAGKYTERFTAKNYGAGPGVYFIRINIDGNTSSIRLLETN